MPKDWKVVAIERAFELAILSAELHEYNSSDWSKERHYVSLNMPYVCRTCDWKEQWSTRARQEEADAE
jgi:hypothetical protein